MGENFQFCRRRNMGKWPNRHWRFLSYIYLGLCFLWMCTATKLPIIKNDEDLQSPIDVLSTYTTHLTAKAPKKNKPSDILNTDSISGEDLAEERSNDKSCGNNFLGLKIGESGVIESPNYPENYPPNSECTWWLKSEKNSRIEISCDSLTTQSCENEKYFDFVLLSPSWEWKTFVVLCGNYGANLENPYKITSTTNLAAIHFRSSSKNQFKGFSCKWNVERAIAVTYLKEGKFNGEEGEGNDEKN